jgi:hypothetical protein
MMLWLVANKKAAPFGSGPLVLQPFDNLRAQDDRQMPQAVAAVS